MPLPPTDIVDHIVHLSPPGSVQEASDQWRELGFHVIPGGTHADGLTANALVVLKDGVYIELISFTKPLDAYPPSSPERQRRESHRWGSKQPGWIDYAFLGDANSMPPLSEIINERARHDGSDVSFTPEQKGGRERPDGKILKWEITSSSDVAAQGVLPFFCADVTPREWRVPNEPPSNSDHLSTSLGAAHLRILVKSDSFDALSNQFTSVLGAAPSSRASAEAKWTLNTANGKDGLNRPVLILTTPQNDTERQALEANGSGLYEVALWVEKDKEPRSVTTPYGRLVWIPVS